MSASTQPLLSVLAVEIAKAQEKRGSQTVGFRFREQLQDLITRLDQCAWLTSMWHSVHVCTADNAAFITERMPRVSGSDTVVGAGMLWS